MPFKIKFSPQDILIGFLLAGIFVLGFFVSYTVLRLSKVFVAKPAATPESSFSKATPAPINQVNPKKGVYNVLFLGYGGGAHEGGVLTDSIIVVHVDTNTKRAALISVPRDLWVPGNHKINAAAITGFNNVAPVIQNVTGLPINYFVVVNFDGFTKIIDDIGGVSVQVPKTFDDPFYPISGQENNTCGMTADQIDALKAKYSGYNLETQFTCRYEHLHYDQGSANLDGSTALKFARSRHGDSDFGRSLRQFAVLVGIENKLISFQAAGKFNDIVDTVSKIVKTDLDIGTIKSLTQVFGDPKAYTLNQVQLTTGNMLNEGTSSDGQYILYPKTGQFNFSDIQSFINANIN